MSTAATPARSARLRRAIAAYLARHAVDAEGVATAELVVGELVSNVVRHAPGLMWASLTWTEEQPTLSVYDLAPGFAVPDRPPDPLAEHGRGLAIVGTIVDRFEVHVRASGGAKVTARLPVRRPPAVSIDPPRRRSGVLPTMGEADTAGRFGKEAFLRALVVQLAHAVEDTHGPLAAEAAVAQVGIDVGGQMEAAYRAATDAVGTLGPDALGDCFVDLKAAIDGDFRVVEASSSRIVLDNTRCPFGDAVRAAPALCRMTSSVFGGIAAHNTTSRAAILLEERIAVGDAACRVVVLLDPENIPVGAHEYRRPE